ncbi:MAG: AcvB/VirJ family lysyl-phosphatidylglycerol hydrolase [Pseudoxanthomonas sp.]
MIKILVLALVVVSVAMPVHAQERISHGSFDNVTLYRPEAEASQFVLLLSGEAGWDPAMDQVAHALSGEGAMVAGVDMRQLRKRFQRNDDACVLPDGDLENLSHYLQGYARQPTYRTPLLVGYGSGAALAYAMQAVADKDVFAGAISLGFCPVLYIGKPLCTRDQVKFFDNAKGSRVSLVPVGKVVQPWVVLQGAKDNRCEVSVVRDFVGRIEGAAMSTLPDAGHDLVAARNGLPALLASYRALARGRNVALPPPPASLGNLPLIELPATGDGDTFAVLLSGDGGWAGLDKEVADAMVAKGIGVVGFDSLRYFWKARTPDELALDVGRTLHYYAAHWKKSKVVLVGYSQGADVLPFAVNRLPAATRAMVAQTVLMGLGDNASFEFHLANWIGKDDGLPIMPEVRKLKEADTLCVYGDDDDDSICPKIPPGHVHVQVLPGGHHFDGAYDKLAELIVERASGP